MKFIEKQRLIIDFTISSLLRRKRKNSFLLVLFTTLIFSLASTLFFICSIKKEAALVLRNAPEIVVQRFMCGRQSAIPPGYIDTIKRIEGVKSVQPRLWGYYFDAFSGANYTFMVNDSLKERPGDIVIGNGVTRRNAARNRGLVTRKNDLIPFKTYTGSVSSLKIRGILSPGSELLTADLILASESDFRTIFSLPEDYSTDLLLQIENPGRAAAIAALISEMHPDTRTVSREDILKTYEKIFDWRGGIFSAIITGAFFAFFILALDKATSMSAQERNEIGILKAVGWETSDILLMKFWESIAVSLPAFMVGLLAAYLHIYFASATLLKPVLKGWSVLYPNLSLTPAPSLMPFAFLFLITVIPYAMVTAIPCWRPARSAPDLLLRT